MPQMPPSNQNFNRIQTNHDDSQYDFLLLAGSKISSDDIFNQERDIPVSSNGKYYNAADVDNVFVMINGVLTNISEQAYRNNKTLKTLRNEIEQYKNEIDKVTELKNGVQNQLNQSNTERMQLQTKLSQAVPLDVYKNNLNVQQKQAQDLNNKLQAKNTDYRNLLVSSSEKMNQYSKKFKEINQQLNDLSLENKSLKNENNQLKIDNKKLNNKVNKLPTMTEIQDNSKLQSEYDMLKYKYKMLKKFSTQRITTLSKENNQLKR